MLEKWLQVSIRAFMVVGYYIPYPLGAACNRPLQYLLCLTPDNFVKKEPPVEKGVIFLDQAFYT